MKRFLCALAAVYMLAAPICLAQEQEGAAPLNIAAPSAVLMHTSGKVLYEKDAHKPMPPASVTKVMTLLLIMEAIEEGKITRDETVTASAHACSMGGSQIWLKEGEQFSVDEMIKCIAVASANDCAVAMAEHIAGSEEAFVEAMNSRAQELGMQNTHFVNACGLDVEGHVSTAYDIALMSAELIKHKEIFNYTTIWQDTIRDGTFTLTNTNRLIRTYEGMTGLKTGSTSLAGFCLSATAEREGLELIAVVMKAETSAQRSADITTMLNYGFANYVAVTPTPDRPLMPVPVVLGKKPSVSLALEPVQPMVLKKEQASSIEKTIELKDSLPAPVKRGDQVGTMTVKSGDEILQQVAVVAAEDVPFTGVWGIFKSLLRNICMRAEAAV